MKVKFSIIMPVYNVEKYVSQAIESVLNQSNDEWELIIINDGSTDDSFNICKRYSENNNRIKLINKNNSGVADARNKGLENSKGDYIIFLDSDDYLENECLDKLNRNISNEMDIYICSFERVFKDGNKRIFNRYDSLFPNIIANGQIIINNMYNKNIYECSIWANVYKRDFIRNNKLFFTSQLLHEDEEWFLKAMLLANRVQVIDIKLYNTRAGIENSIINSKNYNKNISKIIISDNILRFIKKIEFENESLRERVRLGMTSFYINAVVSSNIFNKNERNKIIEFADEKKYILKNSISTKQKLGKAIFDIFGISLGSKILYNIMR